MSNHGESPTSELEAALIAGAVDEAERPRFYETLLRSEVVVVPAGEMPATVAGVIQANTKVSLSMVELEGEPHVAFFSSDDKLPPGTAFLRLASVDLFRITKGSKLVLNPDSDHGKAFLPDEVASLLDGSLFQPEGTLTAKGGEQQLIGQPKVYPHAFSAAVARFLASEPSVERAYLAQHFIAGMHTEPAILVAVVASAPGFERIAGAIGILAKETRAGEGAVDVTRLQGSLGYFSKQEPIYVRKKRSLFEKFFG